MEHLPIKRIDPANWLPGKMWTLIMLQDKVMIHRAANPSEFFGKDVQPSAGSDQLDMRFAQEYKGLVGMIPLDLDTVDEDSLRAAYKVNGIVDKPSDSSYLWNWPSTVNDAVARVTHNGHTVIVPLRIPASIHPSHITKKYIFPDSTIVELNALQYAVAVAFIVNKWQLDVLATNSNLIQVEYSSMGEEIFVSADDIYSRQSVMDVLFGQVWK